MEVKINREIRQYTESVFFGLDLRQLLFSVAAIVSAAAAWFFLKGKIGKETASWASIISAVPFAAMGFVSYNGMSAEKLLMAWIRSGALKPVRLSAARSSYYIELSEEGRKRRKRH